MLRILSCLGVAAILPAAIVAQPVDNPPRFDIADVHVSAKTLTPYARVTPGRGRYEIKTASMVDLIRLAYGLQPDKILGGPSWLELNRYDIVAKLPVDATSDTQKLMLQSLLADRFSLIVHKDSRSLSSYVLTAGKNPKLKEADGSGSSGCRLQSQSGPAAEGGARTMMNGSPIALGPGNVIQYQCRNMTIGNFAAGLGGMLGVSVGSNPVVDQTGLKGAWNFDVKWSLQINGASPAAANAPERITAIDAIDKQLGLKLEEQKVPVPVVVVDSVNEKPTDNPLGVAEALPPILTATEFEVADVKPTDPAFQGFRSSTQTGRFVAQGMPLQLLLQQAFGGLQAGRDQFADMPAFADTERFDITAKSPAGVATDQESTAAMMRSLLVDRFKLKYHSEERPVSAYTMVAVKPKMRKADPASRTHCLRNAPTGPPPPPGSQTIACQNATMALFAEQLHNVGSGITVPVLDATNLQGNWDFTLTWVQNPGGPGRGGDAAPAGNEVPSASDPTGGLTLFEAIDKQLGLKLELQKRPVSMIVIDHLNQKPTEN